MATIDVKVKAENPYYQGKVVWDLNTYNLTFRWSRVYEKWYLDIEGLTNDVDIKRIALMPGKNLLAQHGYGDCLGELWLVDKSEADEPPDFHSIGSRWLLQYTEL